MPAGNGLGICAYGLNWLRVDSDLLIAGIVISDYTYASPAWKKQRRMLPVVHPSDLGRAVQAYKSEQQIQQFSAEYLQTMRPEILKGLSFLHDYRQINTQIIQNIHAHLEERFPYLDLDAQLARASHEERAIYEAAHFLEEKLNVARFLLNPEWLLVEDACSRFRVHGLVTKYVKIYESRCDTKGIRCRILGESFREVTANPSACAVIPHTLLDNAVKYAPDGSSIDIVVRDVPDGVHLEVSSHGPAIAPDEEAAIFGPFVRGRAASALVDEGAGYGLFVGQLVARQHLGTVISVKQDRRRTRFDARFLTTFAVLFPQRAAILVL